MWPFIHFLPSMGGIGMGMRLHSSLSLCRVIRMPSMCSFHPYPAHPLRKFCRFEQILSKKRPGNHRKKSPKACFRGAQGAPADLATGNMLLALCLQPKKVPKMLQDCLRRPVWRLARVNQRPGGRAKAKAKAGRRAGAARPRTLRVFFSSFQLSPCLFFLPF